MGRNPAFGVQLSSAFLPVNEGFLKIGPANGKPPATSRARHEYDQAAEQFDSVCKGVARNPVQLLGLRLVVLEQGRISEEEDGSLYVSPLDRTTQLRQDSMLLYAVSHPASQLISFYRQGEHLFLETLSKALGRLTAAPLERGTWS